MYDNSTSSATQDRPTIQRDSPLGDFLRLGFRGSVFLITLAATLATIVAFVPEKNDYARATLAKHQRLAQIDSRKIVLVGGSNLSLGIDSKLIERATGCPVVNMGMNGYFGVRYMIEEVKADINPHDIVVLAFEWDNFYKSVDGAASDLLAVIKANPPAFTYLSTRQKLNLIAAIPPIAQAKAMRLSEDLIKNRKIGGYDDFPQWLQIAIRVAAADAFSPEGDLISHLDVPWPYPRREGIIPADNIIDPHVIPTIRDFAANLTKRGIAVMVSYTPIPQGFYNKHRVTFNEVHKLIKATALLVAPSPPSAFVYDEELFWDTVYHLNAKGRPLRTQKLIQDLETQWQERVHCPNAIAATARE